MGTCRLMAHLPGHHETEIAKILIGAIVAIVGVGFLVATLIKVWL